MAKNKTSVMKAEIKGKKLTLTLDLIDPPRRSKGGEGKTMLHATTGGNKLSGLQVKNKDLIIGVNAYTYIE